MPVGTTGELRPPRKIIRPRRNMARILQSLASQFPFEQRPDLAPFVNWGGTANQPIHRWLRYREAYSAQLIQALDLGKRILDPFCGCGSIMIGAAKHNRRSMGLDINPLAAFTASVKLNPLSQRQIKTIKRFSSTLRQRIPSTEPWPVPALSISHKAFEPEILEVVLTLRRLIDIEKQYDTGVGDFLLLAWIAILETVGSYFKEGNGIKYRNKKRRRGSYTNRPDGEWQLKRFGSNQRNFALTAFDRQLGMMLDDVNEWNKGNWTDQLVVCEDALNVRKAAKRRRFDSIVFSPPYANRFDYFESLKVELWFGGFVNSYEDLRSLRKSSLRSHLGSDLRKPTIFIDELEELISFMDRDASSWRMGVPDLLRGYFDDMLSVLHQCRTLAPNGDCHIIVGNSAFAGVIIPTDTLIAKLGLEAGFKDAKINPVRHLTVSPQQRSLLNGHTEHMRESVVSLR